MQFGGPANRTLTEKSRLLGIEVKRTKKWKKLKLISLIIAGSIPWIFLIIYIVIYYVPWIYSNCETMLFILNNLWWCNSIEWEVAPVKESSLNFNDVGIIKIMLYFYINVKKLLLQWRVNVNYIKKQLYKNYFLMRGRDIE